ncbi:carboxymuconolactone decarboxylase family protein [Xanthobacter sp.]|uniref:carboxymuconolactone decarboxylase family protein n=1 Tax=Xanthobacter sp. TaxID=35809 RepID=UPI0025F574A9|nr:carboxymuconolactone decarboxylase family protein [Xanthobacter sp.]
MTETTEAASLLHKGMEIRKAVLGAAHVERSMANVDEFARPLQELVTEYCWGAIWGRPGLERRTRSMLNIVMLSALNRPHELKLHVRGALTNGVTRDEIREVVLQIAIYCGVPVALETSRIAQEVFREVDAAAAAG